MAKYNYRKQYNNFNKRNLTKVYSNIKIKLILILYISCEKYLKYWFIDKGNNNCGYCRA